MVSVVIYCVFPVRGACLLSRFSLVGLEARKSGARFASANDLAASPAARVHCDRHDRRLDAGCWTVRPAAISADRPRLQRNADGWFRFGVYLRLADWGADFP